ncbi:MAG: peptidoglycan editing factor PgeF [Gammaproteobacteria bacterium]|nr:peptidoglycan editing factor PgeF [Gammaproteobacteria bacterium]
MTIDLITPDWSAPAGVVACSTTRRGGTSQGPYASLNLGDHVGDEAAAVAANRERLAAVMDLPAAPSWLQQVHGTRVRLPGDGDACGDACFENRPDRVCAVMTADCLPVLFCNTAGTAVAAAHAGWRGLQAGVLEQTVAAFTDPPTQLLAWLGPAIGPGAFEVGDEVRAAFMAHDVRSAGCFVEHGRGHWLADIYALARQRLQACGVGDISGGGFCTYTEAERFFSYRRDGISGRMASLIWFRH